MHERQAVVFGLLIGALILVGLFAVGIATGAVKSPVDRSIQTASPDDDAMTTAQPCVPAKTKPVSYGRIKVNIYNASSRAGLATTVSRELDARGFKTGTIGNSTQDIKSQRIVFGPKGVAAAYTLAAQVPDAKLVLDARKNRTVDVVLSASYSALVPLDDVELSPRKSMTSVAGCVPLKDVTPLAPLPKATPTVKVKG
ncbi:LytR cell envelope-related transcriptional attenuator [Luteimicrobium subarcticum]|uniref:LytR cell envelope-related transcriptional attenuator n=2 Tax=Luteimicrobium subarcticum TaxID=620910 RepID=A0A2M8W6N3_9MICO|nr:LytR cell envelope-related transcriptional attenuator [Luteimicrobium subarcticum]